MEYIISVIVPVYQCQTTLSASVHSVLDCPDERIQLILVDDGSEDDSLQLCRQFQAQDDRVMVIHQENHGVSSARNKGIETATGRYLLFLDADDQMIPQAWELILRHAEEGQQDFIGYSYTSVFPNGKMIYQPFPLDGANHTEQYEKIIQMLFYTPFLCMCWGNLFLREIVEKFHIRFPISVHLGEDYIFVMDFLSKTVSVVLVNQPVLLYFQNHSGAVRKVEAEKYITGMNAVWRKSQYLCQDAPFLSYYDGMCVQQFSTLLYYLQLCAREKGALHGAFKKLLLSPVSKEILMRVRPKQLTRLKKMEYILASMKSIVPFWMYLKVKAKLKEIREQGRYGKG